MAVLNWLQPLGIDLFCVNKKFLVFNMIARNLKIKYRRSAFGVLWTLLVPLGTALVYYAVFKSVFKVQLPNHLIFILSGVLPWSFFSQTISEGTDSLVGNSGLVTKVPIPIQVFPFVGTLTNFISLALSFPVIIGAAMVAGEGINLYWFSIPCLLSMLFLQAYSISIILSILYVYFRDLKHILSIILQVWFYITPVIYDTSMVPERFQFVIYANPIAFIIQGLHEVMAKGVAVTPEAWAFSTAWTIVIVLLALFVMRNSGKTLIERI